MKDAVDAMLAIALIIAVTIGSVLLAFLPFAALAAVIGLMWKIVAWIVR